MEYDWISVNDKLPQEKIYVLVKLNKNNWIDNDDQENVTCVVAKLSCGLSIIEREKLNKNNPRYNLYKNEDEHGNNKVPYCWKSFGPGDYFGQEVSHWMYIKPIKK